MDAELNNVKTISEAQLLELIVEPKLPADRAGQVRFFGNRILDGSTVVLSLASEPLSTSIVFENLLRSLDAALRYELISFATERAEAAIPTRGQLVPADETVVANLLDCANVLLSGQPVFPAIIEFAQQVLTAPNQLPHSVQLQSARILYDADALGESPLVWMDLCTRHLDSSDDIAFVALSALMLRWPEESLEYLFRISAAAPSDMVHGLADLISVSGQEITAGVSFEYFSNLYNQYASRFADDTGRLPPRPVAPLCQNEFHSRSL